MTGTISNNIQCTYHLKKSNSSHDSIVCIYMYVHVYHSLPLHITYACMTGTISNNIQCTYHLKKSNSYHDSIVCIYMYVHVYHSLKSTVITDNYFKTQANTHIDGVMYEHVLYIRIVYIFTFNYLNSVKINIKLD